MDTSAFSRPAFIVIAGLAAPALAAVVGLVFSRYGSPLHVAAWFVVAAGIAVAAGLYLRRPAVEVIVGALVAALLEGLACSWSSSKCRV